MENVISAFLISLVITGILIPKILLISFRKKLFDMPDERKIHIGAVPRLGGIAFMPAIFFSIACVMGFDIMSPNSIPDILIRESDPLVLCFGLCSIMSIYLVGIADDLIGVRYSAKFVVQLFVSGFLIMAGLYINNLSGFLGINQMPFPASVALTVVVIVFFINAINLIDGVDGLASGLSSIAFLSFGISFLYMGENLWAILSFASLGAMVPFFYYNVFGNTESGKKIFMGDTGALTIGVILSILSIHLCNFKNVGDLDYNPFVMAFSPMIVPCFDVLRVFGNRILHHKSPFLPDQTHIHHKFLALGLNQRQTMPVILIIYLLFTVINVVLSPIVNVTWLVAADVAVWFGGNMLLTSFINRRKLQCKNI